MLSRNVSRAAGTENVTDAKVLFKASLVAAANIKPREKRPGVTEPGRAYQEATGTRTGCD